MRGESLSSSGLCNPRWPMQCQQVHRELREHNAVSLTHLFLGHAILVLSEIWVLDQAGKFLKMLEPSLESILAQFAEGKLVLVVPDLFEHGVEVVLIEDQFDESLRRQR